MLPFIGLADGLEILEIESSENRRTGSPGAAKVQNSVGSRKAQMPPPDALASSKAVSAQAIGPLQIVTLLGDDSA